MKKVKEEIRHGSGEMMNTTTTTTITTTKKQVAKGVFELSWKKI
jgi:hypothetical protein